MPIQELQAFQVAVQIGIALFGGLVGIIWYFLKRKDDQQERDIKSLWEAHASDSQRLTDLSIEIAKKHYERPELDGRFDKLEASFRDGLKELGGKFDRLADALIHKGSGQ